MHVGYKSKSKEGRFEPVGLQLVTVFRNVEIISTSISRGVQHVALVAREGGAGLV